MTKQVTDDPSLLTLMLDDRTDIDDIYQTTNYWAVYERKFVPEIYNHGLNNFRRRKNSVLGSFGATDLYPRLGQINMWKSILFKNRAAKSIPGCDSFVNWLNDKLNRFLPHENSFSLNDIYQLHFEYADMLAEKYKAKPMKEFEDSLIGEPESVYTFNGNQYTFKILKYYVLYVHCCKYFDFDRISTFVELGPGAGTQVEILKKLFPKMAFIVFDIPPQLYVCEQYLKAVFQDDVVSYRTTRDWEVLEALEPGKIYILSNWKFDLLQGTQVDLFWNDASFQEMEPNVAEHYLNIVNNCASNVFLNEVMDGKEVAKEEGKHGVLDQVTLANYRNTLQDFDLLELSPASLPIRRRNTYTNSFWKRKSS